MFARHSHRSFIGSPAAAGDLLENSFDFHSQSDLVFWLSFISIAVEELPKFFSLNFTFIFFLSYSFDIVLKGRDDFDFLFDFSPQGSYLP